MWKNSQLCHWEFNYLEQHGSVGRLCDPTRTVQVHKAGSCRTLGLVMPEDSGHMGAPWLLAEISFQDRLE